VRAEVAERGCAGSARQRRGCHHLIVGWFSAGGGNGDVIEVRVCEGGGGEKLQ
jgi:hypothetical protein